MAETAEDKTMDILKLTGVVTSSFDMSVFRYRNDIECICDADTMTPFQSPRIDAVGLSFDRIQYITSYAQD